MPFNLPKQWTFGPYLICASNPFLARRAYEILKSDEALNERSGTIRLPSGDLVRWTNIARIRDYRFSGRHI